MRKVARMDFGLGKAREKVVARGCHGLGEVVVERAASAFGGEMNGLAARSTRVTVRSTTGNLPVGGDGLNGLAARSTILAFLHLPNYNDLP